MSSTPQDIYDLWFEEDRGIEPPELEGGEISTDEGEETPDQDVFDDIDLF